MERLSHSARIGGCAMKNLRALLRRPLRSSLSPRTGPRRRSRRRLGRRVSPTPARSIFSRSADDPSESAERRMPGSVGNARHESGTGFPRRPGTPRWRIDRRGVAVARSRVRRRHRSPRGPSSRVGGAVSAHRGPPAPSGRYPAPLISGSPARSGARGRWLVDRQRAEELSGVASSGHATVGLESVGGRSELVDGVGSSSGSVRSRPIPASAMIFPAQVPVRSDNCEFHISAGVRAARASTHPSSTRVTSWSGGRVRLPRAPTQLDVGAHRTRAAR